MNAVNRGPRAIFANWGEYDKYLQRRCDRSAFREWLLQARQEDPDTILETFSEILGVVFVFLADGLATSQSRQTHGLEQRAWVLLYAVRPDLIHGESTVDAAERMGLTPGALRQKLMELREVIPALKIDTDSRRGHAMDKAASSERKRVAAYKRLEQQEVLWAKITGTAE
jgi:hypothetical protein